MLENKNTNRNYFYHAEDESSMCENDTMLSAIYCSSFSVCISFHQKHFGPDGVIAYMYTEGSIGDVMEDALPQGVTRCQSR